MKTQTTPNNILLIQKSVISTVNKLQLKLAQPKTAKEYTHQIRLGIKHLRAWLILMHKSSDEHDWKKTERRLLKISKSLSANRDIIVMIDILHTLINNPNTLTDQTAIHNLQQQLNRELEQSIINWKEFDAALSKELCIIKNSLSSSLSKNTIKNGLKYTYKKVKQHGDSAFSKKRNYKRLHKLRNWVKHLNYQLAYIQKGFPKSHVKLKNDIDCLGDQLGKLHDLVVTKKRINRLSRQSDDLERLMENKINLMFNKSKQKYKSIFILSSKAFIEQI